MDTLRYSDLPRRRVFNGSFKKKTLTSYGIMAFAKDTKRWLMVRSNHSFGLAYLLFGAYRPVDIDKILSTLTKTELNRTQSIVSLFNGEDDDVIISRGLYDDLYIEYTGIKNTADVKKYGYCRMCDLRDEILEYDETNLEDENAYAFPKGRQKYREDTIVSATREFFEETGISVTGSVNPTPITVSDTTFPEKQYTIKCWVYLLEKEIDLSKHDIIDTKEIKDRKWVEIPITIENKGKGNIKGLTIEADEKVEVNVGFEAASLCFKYYKILTDLPENISRYPPGFCNVSRMMREERVMEIEGKTTDEPSGDEVII